ncbi:hypothetical protein PAF17_19080 [Paracoccus sp. Z330]|uniref:AAA+ ATPase domain-containing protein n=1 Tax=Paracoccus onchidii TaxID=3017813 RepID=A0ABT4ZJM9_9RHOB|nr:hypothetical protein [Paracoccus onchidii]MDB6179576.1 hypothetical protein [Paracoccus onchidii]
MVFRTVSPSLYRAFHAPPPADRIFLSAGCLSALEQLDRAVTARLPLILLTAPPGTGKSVLIGYFAARIAARGKMQTPYHFHHHGQDLTAALSGVSQGPNPEPSCHRLYILDDAQTLTGAQQQLALRIASPPHPRNKTTSLIALGHNQLLTEMKSWISDAGLSLQCHDIRLAPLNPDEIGAYITHRIETCGQDGDHPAPFAPDAIRLLYDLSDGVPRFLDRFAELALHEAMHEGQGQIDAAFMRATLIDTSQLQIGLPASRPHWQNSQTATQPSAAPTKAPAKTGLRADPDGAILPQNHIPRSKPKTQILLTSGLILTVCLGVFVWKGGMSGWIHPVSIRQPPVSLPQPSAEVAAPDRSEHSLSDMSSGLAAPTFVRGEPDAAHLMQQALASEATHPEDAILKYELAALLGNTRAAYYLGQLLELGAQDVPADPIRAQAWYSMASDIQGARSRTETLAQTAPHTVRTGRPALRHHVVFSSGQVAIHWATLDGRTARRYLVQYVESGSDGSILNRETTLTATLLPNPVIRWRVIGLDPLGRQHGMTQWSRAIPTPK